MLIFTVLISYQTNAIVGLWMGKLLLGEHKIKHAFVNLCNFTVQLVIDIELRLAVTLKISARFHIVTVFCSFKGLAPDFDSLFYKIDSKLGSL